MVRRLTLFCVVMCFWSAASGANDGLPTLEDAGYAYEASRECEAMTVDATPTRRLLRKGQFRVGRRIFQNAVKQWGREWACATAQQNHGTVVDLGKYDVTRRSKRRINTKLPPIPVFQRELFDMAPTAE